LDVLREFPADVQKKLGFALYQAQIGERHETASPMRGFDTAVWEVHANDPSGTFRAVYVVRLKNAVYALHTFQKKSKSGIATPLREIEMIRRRLRVARAIDSRGEKS